MLNAAVGINGLIFGIHKTIMVSRIDFIACDMKFFFVILPGSVRSR